MLPGKRNRRGEKGRAGKRDAKEKERGKESERTGFGKKQEAAGLVVGAKGRSSQGDENFEIKR